MHKGQWWDRTSGTFSMTKNTNASGRKLVAYANDIAVVVWAKNENKLKKNIETVVNKILLAFHWKK